MKYLNQIAVVGMMALSLCACEHKQALPEPVTEQPGQPEDVISAYTDQIVSNPNNPQLYINRALAYADRNLFDLAQRDIERAMGIDSTRSSHHAAKGEVYFKGRELRLARLSFERAVQLDQANTDALLKLGEVNFLSRRYPEAIKAINDALEVNERLPKAYFLKGFLFKEIGDTTSAISSFQTATEVNPDYYEAYLETGKLLASRGDDKCLEYYETALQLRPKSAEAFYHKGIYLQITGRIDRAAGTYRDLVKADPNSFLGYYNLGYLMLTEYEEFEQAAAYFDSVLAIQPAYVDALYNKGLCYEELRDERTAVAIYKEVLEMDPQHTLAAMGLERLLEK